MKKMSRHLPQEPSQEGDWNRLILDFSVGNRDVKWDRIDYDKFTKNMAKILCYSLLVADKDGFSLEDARGFLASIFVSTLTVEKIDMVTDDGIETLLNEQDPQA